jgi:hypothetical protein
VRWLGSGELHLRGPWLLAIEKGRSRELGNSGLMIPFSIYSLILNEVWSMQRYGQPPCICACVLAYRIMISFILDLVVYILSRFLGALLIMLSTRNSS